MRTSIRGSGHPVLFLHGMPTSSALWNGVVDRLCDRFQCIAVDLPGLGRTAATSDGFRNPAALAMALEAVRVKHAVDKWHLVAHDAGCAVAVHYAHQFPHRVGRLSLLTPSMFPELKPFYLFELLRRPVLGELLAPLINLFFWNVVMRVCLQRNCERSRVIRDFRAPFAGFRGSWRLMSVLRWGKPSEALGSIPQLLPCIPAPTLVVHGSNDPAVPVAFARRTLDLTHNSQLMLLECGHFIPLCEPAAVAAALARFFGSASFPEASAMAAAQASV